MKYEIYMLYAVHEQECCRVWRRTYGNIFSSIIPDNTASANTALTSRFENAENCIVYVPVKCLYSVEAYYLGEIWLFILVQCFFSLL